MADAEQHAEHGEGQYQQWPSQAALPQQLCMHGGWFDLRLTVPQVPPQRERIEATGIETDLAPQQMLMHDTHEIEMPAVELQHGIVSVDDSMLENELQVARCPFKLCRAGG